MHTLCLMLCYKLKTKQKKIKFGALGTIVGELRNTVRRKEEMSRGNFFNIPVNQNVKFSKIRQQNRGEATFRPGSLC